VRGVLLSLLGVLVGVAMVAGGVWGVIGDVRDSGGDESPSAEAKLPHTSSPEECAQVAKRDPRFRNPHDVTLGPYGRAVVQCRGSAVNFTIDIDQNALEPQTFYEIVLERRRRTEEIGSMLTSPSGIRTSPATARAGPEVRLRRYDFLTVREDKFFAPGGRPRREPIRGAL
jgi:hypothetical protein